MINRRYLHIIAAIHSLGGLALVTATIVNGWPWPVYIVAALALLIALAIAVSETP